MFFNLSKKRQELATENRFAELEYPIKNPQKYHKGQVLEDGTIITDVRKIIKPGNIRTSGIFGEYVHVGEIFAGWHWVYEGVKDGKIISL